MTSPWNARQLFSSASVEWRTPDWVMDLVHAEFDLGLDACASDENAQCRRYITAQDDCLQVEWEPRSHGRAVWMNPPWGRQIGRYVRRAHDQARRHSLIVVCLLPASTDTRWWCDYVMKAADVRFFRGRLHFIRSDGHTGPCTKGSALVIFDSSLPGPPQFSVVSRPEKKKQNELFLKKT